MLAAHMLPAHMPAGTSMTDFCVVVAAEICLV